jgi:hypothetical protein
VAPRIRGLEDEVLVLLLAGLHVVGHPDPVLDPPAAAFVEGVFRLQQLLAVGEQPLDAVVGSAFFIRRERHDDVTVGNKALRFEAEQQGKVNRALVLSSATPRPKKVPSFSMNSNGGRVSPRLGLDHADAGRSRIGFLPVGGPEPHDQVALVRRWRSTTSNGELAARARGPWLRRR